MTKQGAIKARMTSPDVCVADVNNFAVMEKGERGKGETAALRHIKENVKQGSAASKTHPADPEVRRRGTRRSQRGEIEAQRCTFLLFGSEIEIKKKNTHTTVLTIRRD